MKRDEVRTLVEDQFYKSLAANGTNITAVPQHELRAIVQAMADGVFAVLDALDDDEGMTPAGATVSASAATPAADLASGAAPSQTAPVDPLAEQLLWRGRPYLTIGTRYELTSQRLRIIRGVLGKSIDEIELVRVRDTRVKQHMGERMVNVGDISVISADPNMPELILHNVKNPIDVRELIRKATMEEKKHRGMAYREDIAEAGQ